MRTFMQEQPKCNMKSLSRDNAGREIPHRLELLIYVDDSFASTQTSHSSANQTICVNFSTQ